MGQHNGKVTNFIRKGDALLVEKIKEMIGENESMDKLISRKRSFKKNIKKSQQQQ